jgi:hypothetical protein
MNKQDLVLTRKCAITWKACPREQLHFPHLANNARYPDFLYAAPSDLYVCGFH